MAITVIRTLAIDHLPKKTFLALWGIAVVRLLLPFSIPSAFSVYSLLGSCVSGKDVAENSLAVVLMPVEVAGQKATMSTNIFSVWLVIWAVGALICALVFGVAYWKCRQEFQTSLPVENAFIKSWLNKHQQKRSISVRQSSRFSAPLTYGVFHPVILMPISTEWADTKSLRYVLEHEYVHIRRFDSITKLVLIATLCVHWFNPLVWVMYILANRDIELSCDEVVVHLLGESAKAAYATTKGISPHGYTLLGAARDIYANGDGIALADLADSEIVDSTAFCLIVNALLIARYGIAALDIQKKQAQEQG